MTRLILRLYPTRWRSRYGDEFAALLEERPLGPFDVADVLLGALDAHLHLRGLDAASAHQKGFAMSVRIGGYGAIVGGLLFISGFAVNAFDGTEDPWPSLGILLAGNAALLVGLIGLSAFQARRHPGLVWAAFSVPFIGNVLVLVGLIAMPLVGDRPFLAGVSPWYVWITGTIAFLLGSGLFALASWRTGGLHRVGTGMLGAAALLTLPGLPVLFGVTNWAPIAPALFPVVLVLFSAGWVVLGATAVRGSRPVALTGGVA